MDMILGIIEPVGIGQPVIIGYEGAAAVRRSIRNIQVDVLIKPEMIAAVGLQHFADGLFVCGFTEELFALPDRLAAVFCLGNRVCMDNPLPEGGPAHFTFDDFHIILLFFILPSYRGWRMRR